MNSLISPSNRVVIIGAGNVGASIAYCLLTKEIARDIIMIDIAEEMLKAQVLDMQDSANFTNGIDINTGSYSDLQDGDIVVVTCGVAQKEGQTRLDLIKTNAGIIRDVLSKIKATGKIVYIMMVTNPVDILTYIAVKESGMPEGMVFGSGTFLDSARLRVALGKKFNVGSISIHAHILGEHGDSSFPVLSSANISGMPLNALVSIDDALYSEVAEVVRDKAYEIIKGKKATYYGIGSAATRIVESILKDEKRIMPLSVMLKGQYGYEDVCVSVPVMIGSKGIKVMGEVSLNEYEKSMMNKSIEVIKSNISELSNTAVV